jgi:uncharacterized C2H2 Zn-finger protein
MSIEVPTNDYERFALPPPPEDSNSLRDATANHIIQEDAHYESQLTENHDQHNSFFASGDYHYENEAPRDMSYLALMSTPGMISEPTPSFSPLSPVTPGVGYYQGNASPTVNYPYAASNIGLGLPLPPNFDKMNPLLNENMAMQYGNPDPYGFGRFQSYPKSYTCSYPQCGMVFNSSKDLRNHVNSHDVSFSYETKNGKSFSCTACGSTFRRLPDLQRHYRSLHSDAKPFVCPHGCGKSFARKDALKRHLVRSNY